MTISVRSLSPAGRGSTTSSLLARGQQKRARSIFGGHAHIDAFVAPTDLDRPQAIFRVAAVAPGLDVEFPAVPGADDVALVGETQAPAGLVGPKLLLDARDHLALAHRAAVMRTVILVGDDAVALAENAEFEGIDPQHPVAAFRKLAELAHHDLVHRLTPSLVLLSRLLWCSCRAVVRELWTSIINRVGRGGTTSADRRS